jgi:predicted amidophosphoribosyltransferase
MSFLAELLALVAPPACLACRAPTARAGSPVCADCLRALPWLRGVRCPRCALPRHRPGGCPAGDAAFDRAWAPLAHEGVARDLVAALKFRGALPVARIMAAQLAANLPPDLRVPAGVLVAVPPHPGRRRGRGYDPADLLARALAARTGLARRDCLRRAGPDVRQVGAGRAQRRRPGRIEIVLARAAPEEALLVDDVHTTGATLEACARALRAGGCRRVAALSYTRAL